ncbi:insulinase family protein [Phormidium yuhuli AB48]|uniref:Insulinase family protein n=1 Tax=Phormidium yuhuli AB48 TaxID=2940671 RepID=A0ABY5ANI8_9CYAN|nr:pitrilysin family protein [Phormidium yuhuli]USR90752.1 insulinase family protein [Phormidium yuhuli AB48]
MTSTLLSRSTPFSLNAPTVRKFANGLTVIAEQVPVEAVNLSLWFNVGSALEPDAMMGTAHFLEHMIFKGSDRLEMGEFERRIEARGAVTNAATSQDYTQFYLTCAPQDLAQLAPLQLDVVLNPQIADEAFQRERQVVLEEIRRSDDNPHRRNYQRAIELAFEELPYRRPVLGSTEIVSGLEAGQMRHFHRTWYRPESLTAVAVGNLPVEELVATVADSFAQVSNDDLAIACPLPPRSFPAPELGFAEVTRREYCDPTLQQARLSLLWRVPGLGQLEETYALDVLGSILGQGRTGRLVRELREERGLVSRVGAGNLSYRLQGLFQVGAQLAADHLQEVEEAIVAQVARLQDELVSEVEMERIRKRVANRFVFGSERPSDRANLYGYFQALVGDVDPALSYPEAVRSLTPEDLREAARKYLSPEAFGVVIVRPG